MNTIRRLACAIFGHKDTLESKHRTENKATILLYKCKRCGQTSWLIAWEGKMGGIAVWNRALTADEIRILTDIPEGKNDQEENANQ